MDERIVTTQDVARGIHAGLTQMKTLMQQWQPDAVVVLWRSGVLAYQSVWGALEAQPRAFGEWSDLARSPIKVNIGRETLDNWRLDEGDFPVYEIVWAVKFHQGTWRLEPGDPRIKALTELYHDFTSFLFARGSVQQEIERLKAGFAEMGWLRKLPHQNSIKVLIVDDTYYLETTLFATAPVIVEEAVNQFLRDHALDFSGRVEIRGHLLLAEEEEGVQFTGWTQPFIDEEGRAFSTEALWDRLTDEVVKQIIRVEVPEEELELPLTEEDVAIFREYYQGPLFNLIFLYVWEVVRGFCDDLDAQGNRLLRPLDTVDALKALSRRYRTEGAGPLVGEYNPELDPLRAMGIIMGYDEDRMAQALLDLQSRIKQRLRRIGAAWARGFEEG